MSDRTYTFTLVSQLQATLERVWAHASTFDGVNRELWPFFRMTFPAEMSQLTLEKIPLGQVAFRSWILLFGFLPIEFDDIRLLELEPGRGFYEVSRLFSVREWRQRRSVTPAREGCVVRDEISFIPVWRVLGPVMSQMYRCVFKWRHRTLRRLFGSSDPSPM